LSLARNIEFLQHLRNRMVRPEDFALRVGVADSVNPLREVVDFGENPGNLRMFCFVPDGLPPSPAIVVVLHGCGQNAAIYDQGAGWSMLARHYGFALLMPEQQSANNAHTCFNWFNSQDIQRGSGEASSIREMVRFLSDEIGADPRRVFVTGLSAGGAMTSVMLATYPDVFSAGAIIAGLPFGVATTVSDALRAMSNPPSRPARALGDLVRRATDYRGPWPRVSVWHGSSDPTVNPSNADAVVKQWLNVHRLSEPPMAKTMMDGYPREVWWNADGETIVESYTVTGMAHGTPLGRGENDHAYGSEGPFLIEAGISSSYHIAKFFGLTGMMQPVTEPVNGHQAPPPSETARSRAVDIATAVRRMLTGVGPTKS